MKLLKAAVIFVLAPTLTPAFDPLSVSLVAGGAVMAWHLFSSDSWLKCRFQECCRKNGTVNFTGKAAARAGGAELVFLPRVVRPSFGRALEDTGLPPTAAL